MQNEKYERKTFCYWQTVTEAMNEKGFAVVPNLLSNKQCTELIQNYDNTNAYRKTVVMERYRFGLGEYKYFNYPLPELIQTIRENGYPKLAPIANSWMKVLNIDKIFPNTFKELQERCHSNNQLKPTVLILKYGKGGTTLCIRICMEIYFSLFKQYFF